MAENWFDKTQAQDGFAQNGSTKTVLHGQAAKGNPLSEKSFIIAVNGVKYDDASDFIRNAATDKVWDDISDAFDNLYKNLADKDNHMWLINFIKKADLNDNDTNSQLPEVHIHVLSGVLTKGREFIHDQRSFAPHPNQRIYDELAENKLDVLGLDNGNGIRAVPLPPGVKEAEQHFIVSDDKYKSFPDFIANATKEEKREFWKTVAQLALPLIEDGKGARVGYYNLQGDVDKKLGHMAVEVAGGENLGQNGLKKRWIDNPNPAPK